jgi:hypothetical protein
MSKNVKEAREELCPIKLFGLIIPSMPSLIFRLAGTYIRFKSNANKAGKIFKKELIHQGIDKVTATELTGIYLESSHIREYIQRIN